MPTPAQERIQKEELARLFGNLVRGRVAAVPILAAFAVFLFWIEPVAWRRAVYAGAVLFLTLFFVGEWIRYRRRGISPGAIPTNLTVAVLSLSVVLIATGGAASPAFYFAIPLGILAGVFVRPPWGWAIVGFLLAVVWTLAALAATGAAPLNLVAWGGGARIGGPPHYPYLHALFLSLVLLIGGAAGRAMRRAVERIIRRALSAQEESLRSHAERAEELTALSGEIAHELKNPLASVKGLAGLLAQHLPDGKGAERLGVLRREVDRMQSILEEFLNFSRPLVPLALGETDTGALCVEVAALHEGMARERGVELHVTADEVRVRCDPRKVKQVLINLVQNALDASPAGAGVEISADPAPGGGALIRVADRGRGLDPALGDAVFSPGVTTKERGSGLGLTIARSLARQHGGELALAARPGGGTVAELSLPARPAEADGGRAA
jgi:two-component system, NtrC family, sensor histidine kinase HydH